MDDYEYFNAMYMALQHDYGVVREFNPNNYRWRIGKNVADRIVTSAWCSKNIYLNLRESPKLFGIEVEIDYKYPEIVRIYEDITDVICEVQNENH